MEEALADRADDSLTHLALKLTDFITYVMKQAFPLFLADCEPIQDTLLDIQDTLLQRFGDMYNHSELQLHKKIWDVVIHDRQGVPKEHSFVDWCRRIAGHRTESTATNSSAASTHLPWSWSSVAQLVMETSVSGCLPPSAARLASSVSSSI